MKRLPTLRNSALEFSDENSSRDIHQMCVMVSPRCQPPCLYAFDTSIRSWISKLFPCQLEYWTWYEFRVLLSVIYTFPKQSFNSHNNLTGQGFQVVTFYQERNWGSEQWSHLFNITQLVGGRARIWNQVCVSAEPTLITQFCLSLGGLGKATSRKWHLGWFFEQYRAGFW